MTWQQLAIAHIAVATIAAVLAIFSARRNADKLTVTVGALRQIANGQLFPAAVARAALRDVGELDEEPDA